MLILGVQCESVSDSSWKCVNLFKSQAGSSPGSGVNASVFYCDSSSTSSIESISPDDKVAIGTKTLSHLTFALITAIFLLPFPPVCSPEASHVTCGPQPCRCRYTSARRLIPFTSPVPFRRAKRLRQPRKSIQSKKNFTRLIEIMTSKKSVLLRERSSSISGRIVIAGMLQHCYFILRRVSFQQRRADLR
ncbi:uncharacterized [Tachysurus ichikawai]